MSEQENPEVIRTSPVTTKPSNYLVGAIITTIFCCLPLGVVSIVYATQVDSKYAAGDYAGAEEASKKAKQFMIWAIVGGAIAAVAYFALVGTAVLASGAAN